MKRPPTQSEPKPTTISTATSVPVSVAPLCNMTERLRHHQQIPNGNISACIRCATLQYDGEVTPSSANSEITALLTAILRQLKKIGTNVNQTAHQINERMIVSPYGLSTSDIQPFVLFRNDLSAIWGHLNQIKERI